MEIIEQEMPCMSKSTPQETYNYYGDASRKVEIKELEDNGAFIAVLSKDVPRDGVRISGTFLYTTKHQPLRAGHTRTEEYVDDREC